MPLAGRWLLVLAAVRRALATGGRPARLVVGSRALWVTNWDSNAVLYGTWQIPDADTSATPDVAKRAASRPVRHRFLRTFRCQVDHGMRDERNGRGGALTCSASCAIAAIRPAHLRLCTMNFASDNTAPVAPAILDAIVAANPRLCARLRQRRLDAARSSGAWPRFSSARSRCSWCRPARRRMRWRWRRSRRPGASCSATPNPTSSPTNAARRNFSAADSSLPACPATAARSRRRRCKARLPAMAAIARIR